MNELELAQHTADVTRYMAYVGFVLWGIAGWVIGRNLLRKKYIKSNGLVNIKLMRKIEGDNFHLNTEVAILRKENKRLLKRSEALGRDNKSLWYWSYNPHSEATFITITQLDKNGEEVAVSQQHLPDKSHWVEPIKYADED